MKIIFVYPYEMRTPFGLHQFDAGDIVEFNSVEDANNILMTGNAVPYTSGAILRKLSTMSPEDISILNEVLITFDGTIKEVVRFEGKEKGRHVKTAPCNAVHKNNSTKLILVQGGQSKCH